MKILIAITLIFTTLFSAEHSGSGKLSLLGEGIAGEAQATGSIQYKYRLYTLTGEPVDILAAQWNISSVTLTYSSDKEYEELGNNLDYTVCDGEETTTCVPSEIMGQARISKLSLRGYGSMLEGVKYSYVFDAGSMANPEVSQSSNPLYTSDVYGKMSYSTPGSKKWEASFYKGSSFHDRRTSIGIMKQQDEDIFYSLEIEKIRFNLGAIKRYVIERNKEEKEKRKKKEKEKQEEVKQEKNAESDVDDEYNRLMSKEKSQFRANAVKAQRALKKAEDELKQREEREKQQKLADAKSLEKKLQAGVGRNAKRERIKEQALVKRKSSVNGIPKSYVVTSTTAVKRDKINGIKFKGKRRGYAVENAYLVTNNKIPMHYLITKSGKVINTNEFFDGSHIQYYSTPKLSLSQISDGRMFIYPTSPNYISATGIRHPIILLDKVGNMIGQYQYEDIVMDKDTLDYSGPYSHASVRLEVGKNNTLVGMMVIENYSNYDVIFFIISEDGKIIPQKHLKDLRSKQYDKARADYYKKWVLHDIRPEIHIYKRSLESLVYYKNSDRGTNRAFTEYVIKVDSTNAKRIACADYMYFDSSLNWFNKNITMYDQCPDDSEYAFIIYTLEPRY